MNLFFNNDIVKLRKQNGETYEDIKADVQPKQKKIFIDDASLPIEEGDIIERILPNSLIEQYKVIDRGFYNDFCGISAHYQVSVKKYTGKSCDFNKKTITRIVNQTINTGLYVADGSTANIEDAMLIGGQENNVQITNESIKKLSDIVNKIEKLTDEIDADRTDMADAIISIREELNNKMPRPRFLKTAFNSIKAIGIGVIANKMTPLVDSALKIIQTL